MIAITGANGQLGRLVLKALKAKGVTDIRALVRSPEKATDLADETVSIQAFDYDRPETLVPALAQVDRLLLVSGSEVGKRDLQHRAVIEAAKQAGVGFIAYTSILNADTSPMILAEEHRATEAALEASGIPHVILRNGWYLENYGAAIQSGLAHGAIAGASGDGRIAAASRQDYAEAAAAVLHAPSTDTRTYELAGSEAFTMSEFAAALSEISGQDVAFSNMEQSAYAQLLQDVGLPAGFAAVLADSDIAASGGALMSESTDLEALIGHKTETLQAFLKRSLQEDAA